MFKLFSVNCQTMNKLTKEPHYCVFDALRWNCIDYNLINNNTSINSELYENKINCTALT